jgi:hypothetical protein
MHRISLVFVLTACGLVASNRPIGFATVTGSMRVDNAEVRGTATVLDGTSLETNSNPSKIAFSNGDRLELAADSAGRIYADRLLLDRGFAQLHASLEYSVVANSLQVVPKRASTLRIGHLAGNTIQVSVTSGEAQVLNSDGLVVASVLPGTGLELTPDTTGAARESNVTGQLTARSGHYYITDGATHVTFELEGNKLDAAVGSCVNATGPSTATNVAQGASELLRVTDFRVTTGCLLQTGASVGPMPSGNKSAVIAGVSGAVAILTVAPLAMAGVFSGGKSNFVSPQ